jgi:hypothetical protein
MYLQNGLVRSISINADAKRFIQNTCKEFYDFVMDGNIALDVRHYNKSCTEAFQGDTNGFKELDSRKFIKWVQVYALYKGYKFTKNKDHHGRYFELTKDDNQ